MNGARIATMKVMPSSVAKLLTSLLWAIWPFLRASESFRAVGSSVFWESSWLSDIARFDQLGIR
jgi:hypothetical protein